jgi:hypothetical protein
MATTIDFLGITYDTGRPLTEGHRRFFREQIQAAGADALDRTMAEVFVTSALNLYDTQSNGTPTPGVTPERTVATGAAGPAPEIPALRAAAGPAPEAPALVAAEAPALVAAEAPALVARPLPQEDGTVSSRIVRAVRRCFGLLD